MTENNNAIDYDNLERALNQDDPVTDDQESQENSNGSTDKQDPTDLSIDELEYDLKGSVTGRFIENRYAENRDAKIIITSKGSTTGLGKTTLGIILCYFADIHGWSSEEKGFVDLKDYVKKYKEVEPHSALLLDEIEQGADSRRSMAEENVELSHAWAQLRYRNVVSVATLPSVSMLDKRLMELADLWINVVEKGKAIPHYLTINDYTGKLERYQIRHPVTGANEIINWPKLNNADFRDIKKKKDRNVRFGEEATYYEKSDIEDAKKKGAKEMRDRMIRAIYRSEHTDLSQTQISKIMKDSDQVEGLSQSMIGNVVNKN